MSPFLVKHHLFLERPDPTILDELYSLTIADTNSRDIIWVSSNHPSSITLKLQDIHDAIKPEGLMDTNCLDFAIRNMAREDAENFENTKCLGWRHYVPSDWKQLINDSNNLKAAYSRESTRLYDASGSHVVFIPVIILGHNENGHEVVKTGHWTLYAFNMHDQKLCILDSLRDASEGGQDPVKRHKEIRKVICDALNKTMNFAFNFLSWEYEFPKVPRQQNSYDSGFFVFNFMRLWDGHQLIRWFSTEIMDLRKNFLAYILSSKINDATTIPDNVTESIKKLPGDATMNIELLKAARAGNANKFLELIDPTRRGDASINVPPTTRCSCFHYEGTTFGCSCFHLERTGMSPTSSEQPLPISIKGVTREGDGVLHIAASFGYVELANQAILKGQDGDLAARLLQLWNDRGDRPLHCAVRSATRCKDMVELILNKARTIREPAISIASLLRVKNLDGQTCLHEAVRLGRTELVQYLVSQDAELNDLSSPSLVQIVDNEGVSPLYLATTLRRDDIVQELTGIASDKPGAALYSGPAGKTALHAAVLLSKEVTCTLVNWNSKLIKIPDKSGSTPLHYFAAGKYTTMTGCIFITNLLLEKDRSSGYCEDSKGSLPIHIAAANGMLPIICQLIKMSPGCELSCNASGQTILHVAVQMGRYWVVQYICSNRNRKWSQMILNTKDNDGNTALHLAVQKGCSRTFGVLMRCREVYLSFRNNNGHTPLDLAVLCGTSGLIHWQGDHGWIRNSLLDVGAEIGTFGGDHLSVEIPKPDKADVDALSEKLNKSAAVMAAIAALVLNATLSIFTNVESIYHNAKNNQANKVEYISVVSLAGTSIAIIISAVSSVRFRIPPLVGGLIILTLSFLLTLKASAERVRLASARGADLLQSSSVFISVSCALFCLNVLFFLMSKIRVHAIARWARIGPFAFCRRLFKYSSLHSNVPGLHIFVFVEVTLLTVAIVLIIALDN